MRKSSIIALLATTILVAGCGLFEPEPKAVPVPKATHVAFADECYIIGDSIAFGTATWPGDENHLSVKPTLSMCKRDAKIGITASAITKRVHDAREIVISAGSNPETPKSALPKYLAQIRATVHAENVRWIVPIETFAADSVRAEAAKHGDKLSVFKSGRQSGCARCDNLHPFTYMPLTRDVLADLAALEKK